MIYRHAITASWIVQLQSNQIIILLEANILSVCTPHYKCSLRGIRWESLQVLDLTIWSKIALAYHAVYLSWIYMKIEDISRMLLKLKLEKNKTKKKQHSERSEYTDVSLCSMLFFLKAKWYGSLNNTHEHGHTNTYTSE